MSALTDSRSRALLAVPPKAMFPKSGNTSDCGEVDGILILASKKRQQKHEQLYHSISSLKGDAESSSSSEDDDGSSSGDDENDSPVLTSQQETMKLLEQQLNAEPCSVDKWLLLLSYSLSAIPILSKNASKARSEISISILARALAVDPRNSTSSVLRLKFMKAGEQVWHESMVRAKWEDVLKTGSIDLWMEWLEWRIRQAERGIDGIIEDGSRALRAFHHDELDEIARIRIFWRVAVALQNAGSSLQHIPAGRTF